MLIYIIFCCVFFWIFFFFVIFFNFFFFFFFQAEDGIRDRNVTGVQTCALPIYVPAPVGDGDLSLIRPESIQRHLESVVVSSEMCRSKKLCQFLRFTVEEVLRGRSEERRVGKECRCRGGRCQLKEKKRTWCVEIG